MIIHYLSLYSIPTESIVNASGNHQINPNRVFSFQSNDDLDKRSYWSTMRKCPLHLGCIVCALLRYEGMCLMLLSIPLLRIGLILPWLVHTEALVALSVRICGEYWGKIRDVRVQSCKTKERDVLWDMSRCITISPLLCRNDCIL